MKWIATLALFLLTITGFAQSATGLSYKLSPNPVINTLEISNEKGIPDNLVISFRDIMGNELRSVFSQDFRTGITSIKVDLSDLPKGILLCRITNPTGDVSTIRIQKI